MFKRKNDDLLKALLAPGRECLRRLSAMRFGATLCSRNNIALRGGVTQARLDYSVEAMTTPEFDDAVTRIEEERIKLGDYVSQYAKSVEKLYEPIVDCLVHYAQKTQAAWAAIRHGGGGSRATFVPAKPKPFGGFSLSDLPVDIVPTGSDFSIFAEEPRKGRPPGVSTKAHEVQKVPAVPPAAHDVRQRNGHRDLDES